MAYEFDGTDDNLDFGLHSSVNDFTLKSMLMWIRHQTTSETDDLLTKSDGAALNPTGWQFSLVDGAVADSGHLQFTQNFSVVDGTWVTANSSVPPGALHAVAVTYDRGATGNDPNIYIDATLQAETETSPPSGSSQVDNGQNLRAGEDDAGGNDYAGGMGFLVYDDTIFSAGDVNRHRWWGVAPGGPSTVSVWQPMWTDDLNNKGTATANGTAFGAVVATNTDRVIPRVERCWAASMGCGR